VFPYVKNAQVYVCPSNAGNTPKGAGGGSNGRFDYASFCSLAGARVTQIKGQSMFTDQTAGNRVSIVPTPVICEEDATSLNAVNLDSGHSNRDQLSHQHNGGSYYASIDGSVQFFREPKVDFNTVAIATWWTTIAPSGATVSLGLGDDNPNNPMKLAGLQGDTLIRFGWFGWK
ncbi:MAG: hypothetical protein ABSH20_27495, partial [Tepidisphaeraceae bacterium]